MRFRYIGPHDAVDLDGVGTVARGAIVNVTGDVARSLAGQATWKRVADPKPKPRKPQTSAADTNTQNGE